MLTADRGTFGGRFPAWGVGVPMEEVPFAARFRDDDWRVGPTYFDEHYAGGHRPASVPALIPAFDELADDGFDPLRVAPLIRDFYKNSGDFNMVMERVEWRRPFGYAAPLYSTLASRLFKQLAVPAPTDRPRAMQSRLGDLDVDQDGTPDYRTWVRYFPTAEGSVGPIFYVAALHTVRVIEAGSRRSLLTVCLPLRRGHKTSVFAFENLPRGGLSLSTTSTRSAIAGSYLVFPDLPHVGEVTYLPALGLGETLRFWVDPTASPAAIVGEHLEYWRGREVFRLQYRIVRGAGRQIRVERATDGVFRAEHT